MLKKPLQWKQCQYPKCGKQIPAFFKTLTVEGVRYKVCQQCAAKVDREKAKVKKEKALAKRKAKRAKITEKKLDIAFSRLVRSVYPPMCMSCKIPLEYSKQQCCHFKGRSARSTRWDIRNCGVGCMSCNYYDSSHAWELGNVLATYWGENNPQLMREIGAKTYQFSDSQKQAMYDLFTSTFTGSPDKIRQEILERYLKIVNEG